MNNLTYDQRLRIEALRASTHVLARIWEPRDNYDITTVGEWSIMLAEQFEKYLEDGNK